MSSDEKSLLPPNTDLMNGKVLIRHYSGTAYNPVVVPNSVVVLLDSDEKILAVSIYQDDGILQ